uniref:UPAR/Ly6 domain-containing protein n=1 Tax=Stegastes partitus TaxID=144197 RepID=A0A3B5AZF8_9TELE
MDPDVENNTHSTIWSFICFLPLLICVLFTHERAFFLLCYYCPLQHKGKPCTNTTSQCLPDQRCSSSRGRYGSIHVLSAQGCLSRELCGSHEMVSYRGVEYNVSHTCCCKDKCNAEPKSDANLKKLNLCLVGLLDHLLVN